MDPLALSATAQTAAATPVGTLAAWLPSLAALLAAYLLGAVPTAYLAGRLLRGIDIRTQGSGNVGATNVFRVLGPGPGVAVLLLDMAKGWAAVALLPGLFHLMPNHWQTLACGVMAVLGHDYTCFLRFKGGKGVATSAGVFLGLEVYAMVLTFGTFAAVFAFTRMVSAGSLAGALALPLFIYLFSDFKGPLSQYKPTFYLVLPLAVLVWVKHIPNLKRILNGTENRIRFGEPKDPDGGEGEGKP